MTPEVGSTANSYEILSKLAEGGMAEIFLARSVNSTGLRRHVVLKRIARERALDMQYVRMFLDEARLAAQLQHPNIAQVFDIGRLGTSYFFTMEYVHGVTVQELLERADQRGVPLPIAAVLAIIAGAAAGLGHAHGKVGLDGKPLGIVHRDVSPSNLMVSFDGHIKVVDFGVAKVIGRPETQAGTIKGKVAYLSPEQCRQMKIDARSDLFSLGIVMWEMLTNQRLFKRDTAFEGMAAIATSPAPLPSRIRADVPPSVDVIARKLLAIEVPERMQSAAQVIEAIEAAALKTKSVVTSATLARLLRELFGTPPEPWLAFERDAMTVMSRPVPADLGAADDPELAHVEQRLTAQFSSANIMATPAPEDSPTTSHDPFDLTDEPETVLRERLLTPVSMRATRIVPSLADEDAYDIPTGRDHEPPDYDQNLPKQLINTLPLEASVRPRRPSVPPPAPTQIDVPAPTVISEVHRGLERHAPAGGQPGLGSQLTIRGSGPFVPPVAPAYHLPVLPPLSARPVPPPPPLPLRWWILGGSLLGIVLTALVVVATRSDPVPAAAIDAAAPVVTIDAAPPDAAPVIEVDAAAAEVTIDAAETDEMGELEAMETEPMPMPMPPRKQTMRTKPELNLAFRQKRYTDIVEACTDMGAEGDKAIVCTLAACRAGNPIAQDWYRSIAPKERTRTVKFCAGAIQDICATDLTACRQ